MGIDKNSLDILDISIVFKSSLVESFLLAKSSYFGFVVKIPDLHLKDALSDVRSYHDVDLKNFSLVTGIFRSVLSHTVEKKRSEFLNSVFLEEKISNLMYVEIFIVLVYLFGKIDCSFRVGLNHIFELLSIVNVVISQGQNDLLDIGKMPAVGHKMRNQSLLIDHTSQQRSVFAESENSIVGLVFGNSKYGLV